MNKKTGWKNWKNDIQKTKTASSEAVAVCENCLRLLDKRTIIKQTNDYEHEQNQG